MSKPRFLADEDLRGSIVSAVRRMRPEIVITTVVEQGLSSASDEEILDTAWDQKWLLVSHHVNTLKALAERQVASGPGVHGLFLVPQSRPTRPVAEPLVLIWAASEFEEWRDRIVYLPF